MRRMRRCLVRATRGWFGHRSMVAASQRTRVPPDARAFASRGGATMLGPPKHRCLDQPIGRSLEDLVPTDHFYRHLDAKLNLSFVREWVTDRYAEGGRPSIDPVVFFKLQLVMFFEGVRSERPPMRVGAGRLSVRWYLGYAPDEPLPDPSSLTRIRERLGLPTFQRFFEHVVKLCQTAGLVWGKELFFDATKVRANADI